MSLFVRYIPMSLGGGGGGGASLTMGAFDGQAGAATGASIVSTQLFMQSATASVPGSVNTGTQTFAGQKTFSTGLTGTLTGSASLNVLTSALGNLTDAGTDGIVVTGGTGATVGSVSLAQHVADSTHNGYLSSTDWSTFNNKQPTGTYVTSLTVTTANGISGSFTAGATPALTLALGAITPSTVNGNTLTTGTGALTLSTFTLTVTGTAAISGTNTGDISLGAVGSSPNANAASLSGQVLTLQPADGSSPGVVTTGSQTIAGQKTFSSAPILSALTASQVVVTDASKIAASLAYASANTASAIVQRDGSGNFSAGTITATLTGTASGNTTYTANNHGVVISGSGNAMTVIAPDASATKLLKSGGASADPTWLAYTDVATASTIMSRDSSGNTRINNLVEGFTTTTTAAGTTTLTVSSTQTQQFTGSTTQTVVLPDATTLVAGQCFVLLNRSTGIVTVNANGGSLIQTMLGGSQAVITAVTVASSTGTWDSQYTVTGLTAPVNPTVQKFTSGTAQTYTTPAGVQYIQVRMVGGGGGGSGSGTAGGTAAVDGGNTTFGTTLLVANGGVKGVFSSTIGGAGGTASLGTGPIGTAISGGTGDGSAFQGTTNQVQPLGGRGANSFYGGGGAAVQAGAAGNGAVTNTGSGGGGGGVSGATNAFFSGTGGGSGGYVDAIITSPLATYAYTVGTAGTAGAAGTSGFAGGAGAAGYIEVTEYYTNFSVNTTSTATAGQYFGGPYSGAAAVPSFKAFQPPTLQKFASGTAQTYTTAAGALYIQVRMVGAGGGGGGSSAAGATNGGNGGDTTFGTQLVAGGGGGGGAATATTGGTGGGGGTATLGSGPIGVAFAAGTGGAGMNVNASAVGGFGAPSALAGGGATGGVSTVQSPQAGKNGGGGGGAFGTASLGAGGGGGAGGFVDAILTSPSATYTYSVGVAGTAGTGTDAGAAGGTGYISVTEFYQ